MQNRPSSTAMEHGEPIVKLYKRAPNALSVSPVVNTRSFHDAFLAMPLPKPVAESAYRQAGRVLAGANGTEFEYLVAIDARTGALVADNLDARPVKLATGFRASDVAKITKCEQGVVLIHNHPWSRQPSYRNIVTAGEYDAITASIVVGHDGSVWYVSVKDPSVVEKLKGAYNSLKDTLADRAESIAARRVIGQENGKTIDWRELR